jgi:predicted DNA-binding transcriptional regulator YafY
LWLEPATDAPPRWNNRPDRLDMACLRTWIRTGRKIALHYRDEQDRESERIVWPVIVGYLDAVRLLIAWCELRQDFRNFRTDRVVEAVSWMSIAWNDQTSSKRNGGARWIRNAGAQTKAFLCR